MMEPHSDGGDGAPLREIAIASRAGARAKILTFGATLRDLEIPWRGEIRRVVLGLAAIDDYRGQSSHMGATAGRFANRIAHGRFTLEGRTFALPCNLAGRHSLHGGGMGFGRRAWRLVAHDAGSVTLGLHSPDGDAGYPGALDVSCVYSLAEPATLRIEMTATTDAPTIVNLAHHSYFNLDGSADARDHELTLYCAFMTPVDGDGIPTGEIRAVANTPFDFRAPRPIREATGQKYDVNFIAARPPGPDGLATLGVLRSPVNGLSMEIRSSAPAVQFYDAANLSIPGEGLEGRRYGAHAGLCLEPQFYPDAPNRRHFPSAALRPGETWRQVTEYRFF